MSPLSPISSNSAGICSSNRIAAVRLTPRLATLIAALTLGASARAAVDFTPTLTQREQAGITFQVLNFKENGRTIAYEPPRGWSYSGSGPRIRFTPPKVNQAFSDVDQVPLQKPQNFDEETKKALQQSTLTSVPAGSAAAGVVSETANPVMLRDNHSYEVIVSYQAFGQEFVMAVIYVNLPDTQLRFRTVARKPDFEAVHNAFRASLFSWQWK